MPQAELMAVDEIEMMLRWRPRDAVMAVRFFHKLIGLSCEELGAAAMISPKRLAAFERAAVYLSERELLALVAAVRSQLRKGNQSLRRQAAARARAERRQGRPRKRSSVTDGTAAVALGSSTAEQWVASEIQM